VDTQVLVVGAGPAGLMLAAELRRRGVGCRLIDLLEEPQHWDRATVVKPRSLELFESLGIAERFLAAGTPQRGFRIHSGGELIFGNTCMFCHNVDGSSGNGDPFPCGGPCPGPNIRNKSRRFIWKMQL
jgi:2-polyprenyl-6-methoxyphenol hydroxylase-like FAD-dependent oxidoreductase